jgi:energy-coupling factor transporter ATP-binding protein EcfA2
MILKLTNFRCFEYKEFLFEEDDNFILISAPSGSGKTTILLAIKFALYGIGNKVVKFDKTSCKVELEIMGFKIVREKKPNRLVLTVGEENIYEDKVAQNIINEKFSEINDFSNFITLTPMDKLEFLEKFAFKDINIVEIKNRCKSLISERNNDLNKTISQMEIIENTVKELNNPEEIKFPFKIKKNDYELFQKNEKIKSKNSDIIIKKLRAKLEILQIELNDVRVLKTYINSKNENIENLINKLEKLSLEEKSIYYKGDSELEKYERNLKIKLSNKKLIILKEKLKDYTDKHDEIISDAKIKSANDILKIDETLWKEYSKDEAEETIKDTKSCLKDAQKILFLRKQIFEEIDIKELENNKEELENFRDNLDDQRNILENLKKQNNVYSCPSCETKLYFNDDNLHLIENFSPSELDIENVKKDIVILQNKIKKLEKLIPDIENKIENNSRLETQILEILSQYEDDIDEESLTDDLRYIQNYYECQIKKEKKKTELLENNFISSFENDIKNIKSEINKLENHLDEDEFEELDEEELRNIIINEKKLKENIERIKIDKKQFEEESINSKNKNKELEQKHISKYHEIKDDKILSHEILDINNQIQENEQKKVQSLLNIEKIEKYNEYLSVKNNYDSWENKLNIIKDKEIEDKKKYSSALMLKEKISEAENIVLMNIINSINYYAKIYLDLFFVDDPISVILSAFKETKKVNKPSINIEIYYKGMECDLNMLSGGEIARVILSYNLALTEIFNIPLLMLDETTANLDQELTNVVFDGIKENFKGKKVLVIAHQVIDGIFDKVVNL